MKQIKSCKTHFPISVFVLGILILTSCTTGYKNDGKEVTWHTWNEGSGHHSMKVNADPETFEILMMIMAEIRRMLSIGET